MNALTLVLLTVSSVGANDTVLLDFSAEWCAPCRQANALVQQLAAQGHPVRIVDVDRDRDLAARFNVQALPCFVMVVNGREVDRSVGSTSRERLLAMLAKVGRSSTPAHNASGQTGPLNLNACDGNCCRTSASADGFKGQGACGEGADSLDQRLLAATARLKVNDPAGHSYGTGTIVDTGEGEALILTCAHIFRDSRGKGPISVDLFCPGNPRGLPGKLISFDMEHDVALVAVRPNVPVTPVKVAPVGYRPRRGDRVISIGCNRGADPTVQHSHVSHTDKVISPPTVQVAGQPVVGRSGGGLFNADGQLVGVCYAADPQDNEGLYAALSSVHTELDQRGLSFVYEKTLQNQPIESRLGAARPPELPKALPADFPQFAESPPSTRREATLPRIQSGVVLSPAEYRALTAEERAALWAMNSGTGSVTCIVQMPDLGGATCEIVLKNVSPEFLQQLASKRQEVDSQLTSRRVEPPAPAMPSHRPWAEQ